MLSGHRTKTQNGLGNGSKNGSTKLKSCSPSGRGKSFHGCGLTSVSPPAPPCVSTTDKQNPIHSKLVSFPGFCLVYRGSLGMRLGLVSPVTALSITSREPLQAKNVHVYKHYFTIAYKQNHTKQQYSLQPRQKQKLKVIVITWAGPTLSRQSRHHSHHCRPLSTAVCP